MAAAASCRRVWAALSCVVAVLVLVACHGSATPTHRSVLDGRPRVPTAEGIVSASTLENITFDNGNGVAQVLPLSRALEVFTAGAANPLPVLQVAGFYVQVKIEHGLVVWICAFGPPVGDPKTVVVVGSVDRVDGDRLLLKGGQTVRVGPTVAARLSATSGARVELSILVSSHQVQQARFLT